MIEERRLALKEIRVLLCLIHHPAFIIVIMRVLLLVCLVFAITQLCLAADPTVINFYGLGGPSCAVPNTFTTYESFLELPEGHAQGGSTWFGPDGSSSTDPITTRKYVCIDAFVRIAI